MDTYLPSPASTDLLAAGHISPKTLLGAGSSERETLGHMIASQIATMILRRDPEEQRTVLVGTGIAKVDLGRESWFDLLELLVKVV
jgi:proteasome assembly chaperone 3